MKEELDKSDLIFDFTTAVKNVNNKIFTFMRVLWMFIQYFTIYITQL